MSYTQEDLDCESCGSTEDVQPSSDGAIVIDLCAACRKARGAEEAALGAEGVSFVILNGAHPEADNEGWEHAARTGSEKTLCGEPVAGMEKLMDHFGDLDSVEAELSCPYCRGALAEGSDAKLDERDWRYEVANGDTQLGLQEWLEHKQEAERTA